MILLTLSIDAIFHTFFMDPSLLVTDYFYDSDSELFIQTIYYNKIK